MIDRCLWKYYLHATTVAGGHKPTFDGDDGVDSLEKLQQIFVFILEHGKVIIYAHHTQLKYVVEVGVTMSTG